MSRQRTESSETHHHVSSAPRVLLHLLHHILRLQRLQIVPSDATFVPRELPVRRRLAREAVPLFAACRFEPLRPRLRGGLFTVSRVTSPRTSGGGDGVLDLIGAGFDILQQVSSIEFECIIRVTVTYCGMARSIG